MAKNGYLAKQKQLVDAYRQAEKDTYVQYMLDTTIITLNDPAVMGKDVFGKKRLEKFVKAWQLAFDHYHLALELKQESDYMQVQMDRKLEAIVGKDLFHPFAERYEWLKKQKY